ncbi:MAG: ABC transporter substrate-binding protein [Rhizomicrobium sp.]
MLNNPIARRPVLALLGASLMVAASCSRGAKTPSSSRKTLVIGRALDDRNLDPAFEASLTDGSVMELAYERLLREVIRDGVPSGEFEGVLAERWEADPSGLIWTFRLKTDRRFSDGTPVTAHAFAFSLKRALSLQPALAANFFWLKRYDVVDDHTLRFELHQRFAIFLNFLAITVEFVNPKVLAHEKNGDQGAAWLSENSAGSGPYQVERWERGQQLVMSSNPHYPTPPRYFDRVVFRFVKEPNARRLELGRGEIDICEGISIDDSERFRATPGAALFDKVSPQIVFIDINNRHPILSDVRVRRALALAVDYEQIIKSVLLGRATPCSGPIPQGMPGYDAALPVMKRDVAAAKALMAQAGHPTLGLTLSYVQGGSTVDSTVLMIQSNFADIGVKLTLEPVAPSAFVSKSLGGEYELAINNFVPAFADPWLVLFPLYFSKNSGAGGNTAFYGNDAVDRLLLQAQAELDANARLSLYRAAEKLILADMPRIFLFSPHALLGYRDEIAGMEYSAWRPLVYNADAMLRRSA